MGIVDAVAQIKAKQANVHIVEEPVHEPLYENPWLRLVQGEHPPLMTGHMPEVYQ